MQFNFNIFSITLLALGAFVLVLAAIVYKRLGGAVRSFSLLKLFIAIWAIAYGFELASGTLDQMLFWIRIEYIGISFLPASWFIFVVYFIGKNEWIKFRSLVAILAIPIITIVLVWTNQYHYWHYKEVGVDNSGEFPLLAIKVGFWYYILTAYFYVMLAWGMYLLIAKFKNADAIFRRQNAAILVAASIPWIVNLLYLMGIRPYSHIDLTPYAFIASAISIAFGLLRLQLFDIVPIARDRIIENMEEGMLVLDVKNRIIDINSTMTRILNWSNKNYIGSNFNNWLSKFPKLERMVIERESGVQSIAIGPSYYEVRVSSLFEKKTVFSGLILLIKDMTPWVQAEIQLKEQTRQLQLSNNAKDQLFSIIAHDLRGPLVSVVNVLNLMEDGSLSEDEFRKLIPVFSNNLHQTYELLENLLYWSKSQMKGERVRVDRINLIDLVSDKLALLEKRANEKNIKVNVNIDGKIYLSADRHMLSLVIRNLLGNAIKFTPKGGSIGINTEWLANGRVRVDISDTGMGISDEDKVKIFGWANYTTRGTDDEQGTGLGLMLSREFIMKNNGELFFESEWGKGSTFSFVLPTA